jgi:hypothetical protein
LGQETAQDVHFYLFRLSSIPAAKVEHVGGSRPVISTKDISAFIKR